MFLYLLAASGLLVHAHYCGDEVASWELFQKAPVCESGCDDEAPAVEEESCCKDKAVALKITTDQQQTAPVKILFGNDAALIPVLPVFNGLFPENALSQSVAVKASGRANAPPGLWQNIPLHKLHMRFTYYG